MCEECIQKLERKINLIETLFSEKNLDINFPIYSLIKWIPSESDFLSRLFLRLKGDQRKNLWSLLVALYVRELHNKNKFYLFTANAVIVSCPSKTERPDHAEQFAKALAIALSVPFIPLIKWNKRNINFFQRRMNRKERLNFESEQHVKFTINPELKELNNSVKAYIFVDDVITTGATAMHAYMALKKPKNFMGLTLGYRAFLASKPSFW